MHIVHLCSELAPIAKVGGLGDVLYGLSKELTRQGHTVEIILPKYDCIDYTQIKNLKVEYRELWSFDGTSRFNNTIWSAEVENLKVLLVESHHPSYYFSRGTIYGCPDDIDRFLYFTRTAMEFLFKSERTPDAIHLHDWPTSVAAPLYQDMYVHLGLKAGGTVLTLHNTQHQGRCSVQNLSRIGLRGEDYLVPEKMQDPQMPHNINLLKGGIEYSTFLTTVSPTYEKEIQLPEGGHGLESVLVKHQAKLKGILNGIDEDFWNPALDEYLIKKFDTHPPLTEEKLEDIFKAKEEHKRHVRTHLGLLPKDAPLVSCITRLVHQKGPHLILHAIRRTIENGGQFILLGSSAAPEIQKLFLDMKKEFADTKQLAMVFDRDEALAHLVFAGSDLLIVPSLFEPCGLTQMIALRYGTVPLVRKTGGLADTVFDIDAPSKPMAERNGFVFESATEEAINQAIDRALDSWSNDSIKWVELMKNGMSCDFSWRHMTPEYIKIYQKLSKSLKTNHPSKKKGRPRAA